MRRRLNARAFSLMEMAIVLAVSGLMFNFVLTTVQSSGTAHVRCVTETRAQLQTIRGAVEKFARNYDRLPLPAARNIASDHVNYGRESSGANIDASGGVSFGALPWQALGLTSDHAADCWGHKYSYAVTTALTTSNSSGGFKDSAVEGNITLKKDASTNVNTGIAYAIISHGEDALGAVKVNWTATNPDHGWCSGATDIRYTNCLANAATLMDAPFRNGKDAGTSYFDDLIVAAGKPKVLSSSANYIVGWGDNQYYAMVQEYGVKAVPKKINAAGYGFTTLSVGGHFMCGLNATGAAYCWGLGNAGQLGDGTYKSSVAPVAVSGGLSFASISSGTYHSCGLTAAGAAYCWGENLYGQLGDNSTTVRFSPVAVSGGLTFGSISAGQYHTCGLTTGGVAYCWGYGGYGQIGNGSTANRSTPTLVSGGFTYLANSIDTGGNHTCAIRSNNTIYCWGRNSYGNLGDGTTTARSSPTLVTGGFTYLAGSLSAGHNHNCAIRSTGATYCWGSNDFYALGDGTTVTQRTSPVAVSGGLSFTSLVSTATNNIPGTCGLTAGGVAYCWGYGGYGHIGNGATAASNVPIAVSGGLTFTMLARGGSTCGKSGGEFYCWGAGANSFGIVGDGSAQNYTQPFPLTMPSVTAVAGGDRHACAVTSSGQAYCWGTNSYGQLGRGVTGYLASVTPELVVGSLSFSSVASYNNHTCGLTTAGAAYCWGENASGKLGDGTTTDSGTPVAVSGGLTFGSISTGHHHTCGLTTGGAAYCWGQNTYGNLGDGTTTSRSVPTAVSGGLTFAANSLIAAGGYTCGLTTMGAAYCWGANSNGQLGDGTTTNRSVPTAVSGGLTFMAGSLTAGAVHTCGLTSAGSAYCWGRNLNNELGDGTTTQRAVPTAVSGGLTFASLAAAMWSTCGLTSAGAAYCWGYNGSGQVGDGTTVNRSVPVAVVGGLTFVAGSLRGSFGSSGGNIFGLVRADPACNNPLTSGYILGNGASVFAYQSATPMGLCVSEYRTCASGTVSGSYTAASCGPACSSTNVSWTIGADTYNATVPMLVAGGSTTVTATSGSNTSSVGAACHATSGTLSLTGGAGCASQTVNWSDAGVDCSGTMPALTGGGSTSVTATSGDYMWGGVVTASCSITGVVTLSNQFCM